MTILSRATALPTTAADRLRETFAMTPFVWLPDHARRAGGDWTLRLSAGRLQRTVRAHIGRPVLVGEMASRTLSWVPMDADALIPGSALPGFDGRLELHLPTSGAPILALTGDYQPPGGWAGKGVDTLLMHHIANHTTARLLAEVREGLLADHPQEERVHVHG